MMPFSHICQHCGLTFTASLRNRKFCSKDCFYSHQAAKPKICNYCGQPFFNPDSSRKFCSHECYSKNIRKYQPIHCPICDIEFTPKNHRGKFCSPECCTESQKKAIPERICQQCEQPFFSRDKRQIFCSHTCFAEHSRVTPIPCKQCHELFVPSKPRIRFCSTQCARLGQKRLYGRKNHFWKHGQYPKPYYGLNWNSQREKAVERDHSTCQRCFKLLKSPSVHHIRPLVMFNGDWKSANQLDNLVCLCRPCHRKVENDIA